MGMGRPIREVSTERSEGRANLVLAHHVQQHPPLILCVTNARLSFCTRADRELHIRGTGVFYEYCNLQVSGGSHG
jgi:hypothetical protein